MHILVLNQHFKINGSSAERRFFEIGRRFAKERHSVTVITGNSGIGLPLGQKKIGLLQKEGMAIIVFNLDNISRVRAAHRLFSIFARRAYRQGRKLPPPDLVLSSSPPLAQAGAAFSLSSFFRVPLILEIREMKDQLVDNRDSAFKRIFCSQVRRKALKAYCRSIVVPKQSIALMVAHILPDQKIAVLPDELDYEELFQEFRKLLTDTRTGCILKDF